LSVSTLKKAVDSAYPEASFRRYLRTDFQRGRALQGAASGLFGVPQKGGCNAKIYLTKLYVAFRPSTLTMRSFVYVNTEIFPGKLLSTTVENSTK
jgi:hypothetical protein